MFVRFLCHRVSEVSRNRERKRRNQLIGPQEGAWPLALRGGASVFDAVDDHMCTSVAPATGP